MKTMNEKAIEYCLEVKGQIHQEFIDDFDAGYKAAQEWISVENDIPQFAGQEFPLLLKDSSGEIFIGYIEEESDITDCIHHYTHWRIIN